MVDLDGFIASLAIPADRKAIVRAELADHVACAREAATREGRDADAAARDALGNLDALRRSLEAIEPAFHISRLHAWLRAAVAGVLVALLVMHAPGVLGGLGALGIAVALAPPRLLELLRAELRAPRVRGMALRGVPIGPALHYVFGLLYIPGFVWLSVIAWHFTHGELHVETPISAFAVMAAVWLVLLVEGVRARTQAA